MFPDLRLAEGVKVLGVEKGAGGAWLLGIVMRLKFSGTEDQSIVITTRKRAFPLIIRS